jgi:hypothetical protein
MVMPEVHSKLTVQIPERAYRSRGSLLIHFKMAKGSKPRPVNGPSTTGKPSGGGRGNNPAK